MTKTLYERLGRAEGIARIVDDETRKDVIAILYSLKGEIIRV